MRDYRLNYDPGEFCGRSELGLRTGPITMENQSRDLFKRVIGPNKILDQLQ
jgi:hypothetical protein